MKNKSDLQQSLTEVGFEIIQEISKGGFSSVYAVSWNMYPKKTYVAKVIDVPPDHKDKGEQSYLNEIGSLCELFHKNIIQIYKHFITNGYMVIIMEFCPNGTMHDYILNNGPLDLKSFRIVAESCLQAVSYCHQNMIAHRDIKPTNILIDERNNIKLCDFGLSDPSKPTFVCQHDGSLPYAPPEVLQRAFYDPKKADIWSLGITFYFLATGKLPWCSLDPNGIRREILMRDIEIPSTVNPLIKNLILPMIRIDPNTRVTADICLKNNLFIVLPPLKNIRKSDSNGDVSIKSMTQAKSRVNRGYTCRATYQRNSFH